MLSISKRSAILFFVLIMIFSALIGLGLLFDVKGIVLLKYDTYLDSKITDRYAFFKKEIEPILLQNGKKYDLSNGQDTTNWKMYENKQYGFSFKYPENAKINEESAGKINDDGAITLADITIDSFTMRISVFSYDRDVYVYHGPHHAKRVFQETVRKGSDAVNYVQSGEIVGYAGYFPVNPWNARKYNGTQYVSRFTFYVKSGMIDFNVRRILWDEIEKEKMTHVMKDILLTFKSF